jgi:hypothetical protein
MNQGSKRRAIRAETETIWIHEKLLVRLNSAKYRLHFGNNPSSRLIRNILKLSCPSQGEWTEQPVWKTKIVLSLFMPIWSCLACNSDRHHHIWFNFEFRTKLHVLYRASPLAPSPVFDLSATASNIRISWLLLMNFCNFCRKTDISCRIFMRAGRFPELRLGSYIWHPMHSLSLYLTREQLAYDSTVDRHPAVTETKLLFAVGSPREYR